MFRKYFCNLIISTWLFPGNALDGLIAAVSVLIARNGITIMPSFGGAPYFDLTELADMQVLNCDIFVEDVGVLLAGETLLSA